VTVYMENDMSLKALPWMLPFILAFAATEASVAAPVTTVLPAVADTTIRQQQANQNRGSDEQTHLGWAQGSRALVRFDPAAIAATVGTGTLVSAHLELDVVETGESWPVESQNVEAHRATAAWTETGATWSCGIDAQPGDNHADCNPLWNGGSFLASPTATVPHTRATLGPVRFDVTADVAAFLAGTANEGWLLKKADETLSGRIDYASKEGPTPEMAPRLVLVVEPRTGDDTTPPTITIEHPAEGDLTNQLSVEVRGTVVDAGGVAAILVNGNPVTLTGDTFVVTVLLEEGFNRILVLATDSFNNRSSAGVVLRLDTEVPRLSLSAPGEGQTVNGDSVRVEGEVSDSGGVGRVIVDGVEVPVADGDFATDVQLQQEGPRTIVVAAVDLAGNSTEVNRIVVHFSLPEVKITAPADLAFVAATTVDVAGTVSTGVTAVSVNSVAASLQGTSFLAQDVPLIEGGNTVTTTATNANGHVGTATIHVVRDLTAPRVAIYQPVPGSVVHENTVSVSGLVNDIVPGTVNAEEATVTINGIAAQVSNRSFFAAAVPLSPGENTLVARAVDASGNAGEARSTVTFDAAAASRVRVVSGDHQAGVIGTTLLQPLVVELLNAANQPVAGRTIIFKVRGNDGSLDGGERQIVLTTDASGRAQTTFTLGTRAGFANQIVEAGSVGFAGPAVFTASALPGEATLIVVDSGGLQIGVAGQQVPRPLIAAVVDSGRNRLEGVPVVFRVNQGSGHFADGSEERVVVTDSDGRAISPFILGPDEGTSNNQVEARIQGLDDGPVVSFIATGRAAGDPAATTISGVVLDNTNVPIAGATLRVRDTGLTAVTDPAGQFRITGAPVGAVKLIVDGSTVSRSGSWPDLEFDLVTISGRDNTVNMPIYLLPLDLANAVFVDDTRGGTLTLPQIPGFALEIAPGSVTFPGGSRSGVVSVTIVHNDKVPMVPNFGQQPQLIVTIQPAGARFDPPARLTLPNVDGLAPGRVTEMYSFDHDLGHFVSIGPATVSDDGTMIVSNPGVGIVKAGWHCGGDPATGVCLHQCPECSICRDPPCKCDIPKDLCTSCSPAGSACDGEHSCKTGKDLIPKICDQLSMGSTNYRRRQCADPPIDPRLDGDIGGPDTCGGVLIIEYTKVEHNCDSIDLKGAKIEEEVNSDHGCGSPQDFKPDQGGTFIVQEGNRIGGGDAYSFCGPARFFPVGTTCTETYTQQQKIEGCTRKVTIAFTITTSTTGCTSSTTR
jgi:hypothetical protein